MNQPRARSRKLVVLTIVALFLVPVAARAALFAYAHGPMSWRDADWSSTGTLPPAAAHARQRKPACLPEQLLCSAEGAPPERASAWLAG